MKDRVPLYPGRVKLIPVSGQENTYDMVRADEPTQEGTPLSKATFLKDATAALFGMDATAVPDDALAVLSRLHNGLGNEYVWEKIKTVPIDVINNHGGVYGNLAIGVNGSTVISQIQNMTFGKSVSIENGDVVLSEIFTPTSEPTSGNLSYWQGLLPFYISYDGRILYAERYVQSADVYVMFYCYIPTIEQKTITTFYGYVNSPDPNAYPPAVSDGYTYTALGQLGAKTQIEAGSYVGTGNSGAGNPNVVTLGFEAKLFMLTQTYFNDANQANLLNVKNYSTIVPFSLLPTSYTENYGPCGVSNLANCYTKRDGNTLYWYVTSGDQFNNAGWTYNYLAIG